MFDLRLERLKKSNPHPWASRALYQLEFAHELSRIAQGEYDGLIAEAVNALVQAAGKDGTITRDSTCRVEELIMPLSKEAKRYEVICAAHAHIDMNWMWRWDETVAVTLDTFRTMLDLMEQYPDFKFSQSQASVYEIVEQYDPGMLEQIRRRVKEGRWEVTASTWVEADKNLPNGESQARHLLYTRRYLSQLLDLKPDQFQLDFEPDTFGHHANVPEILASGGVKYYYHCRGDRFENLYRWVAPSGRSILVYREPHWYLGYVEPDMVLHAPAFCRKYGLASILKVYGVGDHGGGPTRRDLERIQDMARWPVYPRLRFGTFADFFAEAEKVKDQLMEFKGELNFIFTGCYTSQSRIKRANRLSEAALNQAEAFSAFAACKNDPPRVDLFARAWKNTLFNQFHDIIPGSGVIDTREYALGLFQQTLAIASSQKARAFRALTAEAVSAPAQDTRLSDSIAGGAGVGSGVAEFKISQVSRGGGQVRLFHLFNASPWPRRGVYELVVWDWDGNLQRLAITDEAGQALRHQILDHGWNDYWGHKYLRVLVEASVPAGGYGTVVLKELETLPETTFLPNDWRTEEVDLLVLENEHLRAEFDRQSLALVSLVDKAGGAEVVNACRPALFRRIQEDDRLGMTAWTVGRYKDVKELTRNVRLLKLENTGTLRRSLTFETTTGPSKLTVAVSLDAGSHSLDYAVECDWHEIGRKGEGIPQLNFILPLAYPVRAYRYDIPFGTVDRGPVALDVPANSWGLGLPAQEGTPAVQLITECNYGFRGDGDALALTLIRSSYDPDPYPEIGIHRLRFAVRVVDQPVENKDLIGAAFDYTRPVDIVSGAGTQPGQASFLALESGSAMVSAVKAPEEGEGREWIVRLYETDGWQTQAVLRFDPLACGRLAGATWVDSHEQPAGGDGLRVDGERLLCELNPHALAALRVKFV